MKVALRKEEGFTLIELMVVVLIIGILVAVAIPVFASASNNARKRSCEANSRTLDGAVNTYIADNEGTAESYAGAPDVPANIGTDLVPNYMKSVPACPYDGTHAYTLVVDPNNANSMVSSVPCQGAM